MCTTFQDGEKHSCILVNEAVLLTFPGGIFFLFPNLLYLVLFVGVRISRFSGILTICSSSSSLPSSLMVLGESPLFKTQAIYAGVPFIIPTSGC